MTTDRTGSARWPARSRRLSALAIALAGLVTLASSVTGDDPSRQRVLERFEPDAAQAAAHALGGAGGVALLWLALGVLQGRWRAGRAAIVLLGVLVVVHAAKGLDYEEAGLGLAVGAGIAAMLPALREEAAPRRGLVVALSLVLCVAGAYAVALVGLLVAGRPIGVGDAIWSATRAVFDGALPTSAHSAFDVVAGGVLVAVVVAARSLLRPVAARQGHSVDEHARAQAIVAAHGSDSIAPFVLRSDTSFFFAHGGVLAYRVLRGTAVVAGEPVAPPGAAAPIVRDFLAFACDRSWQVVLVSAREERTAAYRALGLRTMQIGLEAVVDPRAFELAGGRMKALRKAVNRVQRLGWTVEVRPAAALTDGEVAEILELDAAWRAATGRRLQGFSMAADRLWGAPEDQHDLYCLGRDPDGRLWAFQRYVPYRQGLSLDAMRRLEGHPNGLADALVVAAIGHARERGLEEVSLNFSGFGHLMAAEALTRRTHLLMRWALRRMHGRFQLERLALFAQKFEPTWRSRHLVFTSRTSLPLVALRVLQAEAYLRPPVQRPRRDAWMPAPLPVRPTR